MVTGLIIGFVFGFIVALLFARFLIKKTLKNKTSEFTDVLNNASDFLNSFYLGDQNDKKD